MNDNDSDRLLSASFVLSCIQRLHYFGPYNNLLDRKLNGYVGVPLLSWTIQKGNYCKTIEDSNQVVSQESRSPTVKCSNGNCVFDKNIGFITQENSILNLLVSSSVNINDKEAYLDLVDHIISSGVHNYQGIRSPLPSVFNLKYIQEEIESYHDKKLLDYLTFGFSLG